MVTLPKVTNGVAQFLDSELLPKMSGWQKWAFYATASAYLAQAPELINKVKTIKAFEPLCLIDGQNNIDIEKIYTHVRPAAEKCPASINIPLVGTITLNVSDVDKLYNYIMNG